MAESVVVRINSLIDEKRAKLQRCTSLVNSANELDASIVGLENEVVRITDAGKRNGHRSVKYSQFEWTIDGDKYACDLTLSFGFDKAVEFMLARLREKLDELRDRRDRIEVQMKEMLGDE